MRCTTNDVIIICRYVTTLLVQFFQCQRIEGRAYLVTDYSRLCFDRSWKLMLIAELCLAAVYPLAGPVLVFLLLRYKRAEVNVRFLTAQYKEEFYFWDVVEMVRKFALLAAVLWDQDRQVRETRSGEKRMSQRIEERREHTQRDFVI
jgi:hypothetical protein